jgi:hypothetical protein
MAKVILYLTNQALRYEDYGGADVYIHVSLSSEVVRVEWSASRSRSCTPLPVGLQAG